MIGPCVPADSPRTQDLGFQQSQECNREGSKVCAHGTRGARVLCRMNVADSLLISLQPTLPALPSPAAVTSSVVESTKQSLSSVTSAVSGIGDAAAKRARTTRNWTIGLVVLGVFAYGAGTATPHAIKDYLLKSSEAKKHGPPEGATPSAKA